MQRQQHSTSERKETLTQEELETDIRLNLERGTISRELAQTYHAVVQHPAPFFKMAGFGQLAGWTLSLYAYSVLRDVNNHYAITLTNLAGDHNCHTIDSSGSKNLEVFCGENSPYNTFLPAKATIETFLHFKPYVYMSLSLLPTFITGCYFGARASVRMQNRLNQTAEILVEEKKSNPPTSIEPYSQFITELTKAIKEQPLSQLGDISMSELLRDARISSEGSQYSWMTRTKGVFATCANVFNPLKDGVYLLGRAIYKHPRYIIVRTMIGTFNYGAAPLFLTYGFWSEPQYELHRKTRLSELVKINAHHGCIDYTIQNRPDVFCGETNTYEYLAANIRGTAENMATVGYQAAAPFGIFLENFHLLAAALSFAYALEITIDFEAAQLKKERREKRLKATQNEVAEKSITITPDEIERLRNAAKEKNNWVAALKLAYFFKYSSQKKDKQAHQAAIQAFVWFKFTAEKYKNPSAIRELIHCYQNGIGTPTDPVEAKKCEAIAATPVEEKQTAREQKEMRRNENQIVRKESTEHKSPAEYKEGSQQKSTKEKIKSSIRSVLSDFSPVEAMVAIKNNPRPFLTATSIGAMLSTPFFLYGLIKQPRFWTFHTKAYLEIVNADEFCTNYFQGNSVITDCFPPSHTLPSFAYYHAISSLYPHCKEYFYMPYASLVPLLLGSYIGIRMAVRMHNGLNEPMDIPIKENHTHYSFDLETAIDEQPLALRGKIPVQKLIDDARFSAEIQSYSSLARDALNQVAHTFNPLIDGLQILTRAVCKHPFKLLYRTAVGGLLYGSIPTVSAYITDHFRYMHFFNERLSELTKWQLRIGIPTEYGLRMSECDIKYSYFHFNQELICEVPNGWDKKTTQEVWDRVAQVTTNANEFGFELLILIKYYAAIASLALSFIRALEDTVAIEARKFYQERKEIRAKATQIADEKNEFVATPEDIEKLGKAAEKDGNWVASLKLAFYFKHQALKSTGRQAKYAAAQAFMWFKFSAKEYNNPSAIRELINCYKNGFGITVDLAKAKKWQEIADQSAESPKAEAKLSQSKAETKTSPQKTTWSLGLSTIPRQLSGRLRGISNRLPSLPSLPSLPHVPTRTEIANAFRSLCHTRPTRVETVAEEVTIQQERVEQKEFPNTQLAAAPQHDELQREREEKEQAAKEKAEREQREQQEKERAAKEKAEHEERERQAKIAKEQSEREERERQEKEKAAKEKADREERERQARVAKETAEREQRERQEKEKAAKEKAEHEERELQAKIAKEQSKREERERQAKEKAAKEKAQREERERQARLAKEKAEREQRERQEKEKAAKEKAQREERERQARLAKEKAEREQRERQEKEKAAKEKAEREERERQEKENAIRQERLRQSQADKAKALREKRERRKQAAKVKAEREERERQEKEKAAKEKNERDERDRQEAEIAAKEQAEREEQLRLEALAAKEQTEREERERQEKEIAAKEQAEREERERKEQQAIKPVVPVAVGSQPRKGRQRHRSTRREKSKTQFKPMTTIVEADETSKPTPSADSEPVLIVPTNSKLGLLLKGPKILTLEPTPVLTAEAKGDTELQTAMKIETLNRLGLITKKANIQPAPSDTQKDATAETKTPAPPEPQPKPVVDDQKPKPVFVIYYIPEDTKRLIRAIEALGIKNRGRPYEVLIHGSRVYEPVSLEGSHDDLDRDIDLVTDAPQDEIKKLLESLHYDRIKISFAGPQQIPLCRGVSPDSKQQPDKESKEQTKTWPHLYDINCEADLEKFKKGFGNGDMTHRSMYAKLNDDGTANVYDPCGRGHKDNISREIHFLPPGAKAIFERDPACILETIFAEARGRTLKEEDRSAIIAALPALSAMVKSNPARFLTPLLKNFTRGIAKANFDLIENYDVFDALFPPIKLSAENKQQIGVFFEKVDLITKSKHDKGLLVRSIYAEILFSHLLQMFNDQKGYDPNISLEENIVAAMTNFPLIACQVDRGPEGPTFSKKQWSIQKTVLAHLEQQPSIFAGILKAYMLYVIQNRLYDNNSSLELNITMRIEGLPLLASLPANTKSLLYQSILAELAAEFPQLRTTIPPRETHSVPPPSLPPSFSQPPAQHYTPAPSGYSLVPQQMFAPPPRALHPHAAPSPTAQPVNRGSYTLGPDGRPLARGYATAPAYGTAYSQMFAQQPISSGRVQHRAVPTLSAQQRTFQ